MNDLGVVIGRGLKRWNSAKPRLVRSMTNDATTYFKTLVFNREGYDVQPGGGRWKKNKKGTKTLIDTGTLRRSITANSRGVVGVVSSFAADKKTGKNYGQFHMEGTDKMPQRKFMGESNILNGKFESKILKALQKALEG